MINDSQEKKRKINGQVAREKFVLERYRVIFFMFVLRDTAAVLCRTLLCSRENIFVCKGNRNFSKTDYTSLVIIIGCWLWFWVE